VSTKKAKEPNYIRDDKVQLVGHSINGIWYCVCLGQHGHWTINVPFSKQEEVTLALQEMTIPIRGLSFCSQLTGTFQMDS